MKVKIKSDLTSGVFCLILGAVLRALIPYQIKLSSADTGIIDAQYLPKLIAIAIFVSGVILIVKSKIKEDRIIEINLDHEKKALLYIGVLIIYSFLLAKTTFLISSIFLGIVTLVLLKSKDKRYYGIILGLVVMLKVVFQYVLQVPLP